jgi:hypothetical protein
MFQAYSNAKLNITVAFALDSRDGLFVERDPRSAQPFEVDVE